MREKVDALVAKYEESVRKFGPDLSGKEILRLSLSALCALVLAVAGLWIAGVRGEFVFFLFWLIAFAGSLAALVFAWVFFRSMMKADEGTGEMREIAGHVREGANAYIWRQYTTVFWFFVVICALLAIMSFGLGAQSKWVPLAFLTGGFFSGLSGCLGMKTATWASSRTTAGAQK